jgi:hypothetical protein
LDLGEDVRQSEVPDLIDDLHGGFVSRGRLAEIWSIVSFFLE